MRAFFTLSLLIPALAFAQVPGDTLVMDFDTMSTTLHLDTIYPPGCWQVGTPNKPIFTSALSMPNALVTDTVLPHADSTTCYAEFHMVAGDPSYLGRDIFFDHWVDTDSLEGNGWIEIWDPWSGGVWDPVDQSGSFYGWYQTQFISFDGSKQVFTGGSQGWQPVRLELPCIGVLDQHGDDPEGAYVDTMRLRFAFEGGTNMGQRDGWMIDNVRATATICAGSVGEYADLPSRTYPSPANERVKFEVDLRYGSSITINVLDPMGKLVLNKDGNYGESFNISVDQLPSGSYAYHLTSGDQTSSGHFVVAH